MDTTNDDDELNRLANKYIKTPAKDADATNQAPLDTGNGRRHLTDEEILGDDPPKKEDAIETDAAMNCGPIKGETEGRRRESSTPTEGEDPTNTRNFKTGVVDPVVAGLSEAVRTRVGLWLLLCVAGCYVGVSMGGFTRLNEAAMKMTDLHPFRWIPPFGHWEEEFDNYKKYDEYALLPAEERQELTLNEFIYRWFLVYFHRIGGRMLFFLFVIPCSVFWYKGYFNRPLKYRMTIAGLLMLAQIPLGWYMLNSGLNRNLMANKKKPGVSQYRMAVHLITPFFMFGIFLYNALSLLVEPQNHFKVAKIGSARLLGKILIGLLLVGSFMGSFLTALDAAEPEYARAWIPDDLWVLLPKWKNIFENPVTANFVHRYLGYITFAMINLTFFYCSRLQLLPRADMALKAIMALGYSQLCLGIITLYFRDPAVFAWLHQNFSVHLFSAIIWFVHEIRELPRD